MAYGLVGALLLGCEPEPADGPPADTGTPLTGDLCADAPVVTWDNFGAGFMTQHCDACHLPSSPDRNGAPEDVTFETEERVLEFAGRILATAAGDPPTMPPQGGVDDEDRYLLEVWLSCGG